MQKKIANKKADLGGCIYKKHTNPVEDLGYKDQFHPEIVSGLCVEFLREKNPTALL